MRRIQQFTARSSAHRRCVGISEISERHDERGEYQSLMHVFPGTRCNPAQYMPRHRLGRSNRYPHERITGMAVRERPPGPRCDIRERQRSIHSGHPLGRRANSDESRSERVGNGEVKPVCVGVAAHSDDVSLQCSPRKGGGQQMWTSMPLREQIGALRGKRSTPPALPLMNPENESFTTWLDRRQETGDRISGQGTSIDLLQKFCAKTTP